MYASVEKGQKYFSGKERGREGRSERWEKDVCEMFANESSFFTEY